MYMCNIYIKYMCIYIIIYLSPYFDFLNKYFTPCPTADLYIGKRSVLKDGVKNGLK